MLPLLFHSLRAHSTESVNTEYGHKAFYHTYGEGVKPARPLALPHDHDGDCDHLHSESSQLPLIPYPNQITQKDGHFTLTGETYLYTTAPAEDRSRFIDFLSVQDVPLKLSPIEMERNFIAALIDETMTTEDEYTVDINEENVIIKSGSARGLFYGLQIIIQLYHMSKESGELPCLSIKDCPAFQYRGLMLDVSRHFVPKDFLLKQIDCLAYFKISRFHIHLTDAGGWRLQIKKYPYLTSKAAYREESDWVLWWNNGDKKYSDEGTKGAYGGYYTQEDMREVVKYAADRYITIIPEIEMPGHSEEVLYAYPEYSCSGQPYKNSDFCVGNEGTFEFLQNVLLEVFDIFPSKYIHIGGDEASMGAWYNCPKCQKRMKDNNFTKVEELQSYLIKRIEKFINDNGRTLIGWDEILKGGLAPNAVVMSWTGEGGGIEAAKAGHQVIMTPCGWVYLDYYQDLSVTQPRAIGGFNPLPHVYQYFPIPDAIPEEFRKNIYGVQGNLWTEYVTTPEHTEYMIWPRVIGIAESGWLTKDKKDLNGFIERCRRFLELLESRGYHPYKLDMGDRQESQALIDHLARGKKVTYNSPISPYYPAHGEAELTNGMRGNWAFNDGVWQGFHYDQWHNYTFDVTVDMEKSTQFHEVYITWMQEIDQYIFAPETVKISVSDDGQTWNSIYEQKFPWTGTSVAYWNRGFKGTASGRYIRYQAAHYQDYRHYMFADELVVL